MRWVAALAICVVVCATARADWGVRRDPFDPVVVKRYKAILAHDPHDADALQRLVGMYKSYRTLDLLAKEFRGQLANGDDWATLVVLARLSTTSRTESFSLFKRAVAVKPDDARTWLALGDAATTDAAVARDAFRRAAALATAPKVKRSALTKLIVAARGANDHAAVDAAYAELVKLSPKDGQLWLDRGNAQLAAKHFADARNSLVTAESLLRTDPERQLTAMMNQGLALDGQGRIDDAIAQYEHTLDRVPHGYYLGAEVINRIIELERRRKRLPDAVARLEKRWPEKRRRYFEWSTLGDLYQESGDEQRAIEAFKKAVTQAPTEVVTQRKLIALLDKLHPSEALAQHEAAARVAPGDADLQIELAKRYHPTHPEKALAVLTALGKRLANNVSVHTTLAALYDEWDDHQRAIAEYETIATIEPREPDHAVELAEAYWRADDADKAKAALNRLDKIGTTEALQRHGDMLTMHAEWDAALAAYTKAIALDGANAAAYYGRARSRDELKSYTAAIDDARHAVALTGTQSYSDGLQYRQMLIRALGHEYAEGDKESLTKAVRHWRFAFDRGDVVAGYLLAAHHSRLGSAQQHDVLLQLYRDRPSDASLGIAVSRSYARRHDFDRARRELELIAQRDPTKAQEMSKLIAILEEDRERDERSIRIDEGARANLTSSTSPDIVGRQFRTGMRLELGGDVRNASSALLGIGWYHNRRLATGVAVTTRLDWTQRDDQNEEVNAFALAGAVNARVIDARRFEVALGAGPRFELRYGSDAPMSTWRRAGIGADVTLEILPRALPAVVGLRFDQTLTDSTKSAALLLELGFEVR